MPTLNVNGRIREVTAKADTTLLWVLRVGEPTICVVAPSVMKAVHAATGKPVCSLPLKNLHLA